MTLAAVQPKHTLSLMDPKEGDIKLSWDMDNEDEIEIARAAFTKAKKDGFAFYAMDKGKQTGSVINRFNPDLEDIIGRPQLVGG